MSSFRGKKRRSEAPADSDSSVSRILETPDSSDDDSDNTKQFIQVSEDDPFLPQILGESAVQDDDIPIRLLSNFTIFDERNGKPVSLFSLDHEEDESASEDSSDGDIAFVGSGMVAPLDEFEEPLDVYGLQDSEPGVRVQLTAIFNTHVDFTPSIFIRTQYAWYKLDTPSKEYAKLYESYWIRRRLTALFCAALNNNIKRRKEYDYESFVKSLEVTASCSDEVAQAMQVIGRPLNSDDLRRERKRILEDITYFHKNTTFNFTFDAKHPLYVALNSNFKKCPSARRQPKAPSPAVSMSASVSDEEEEEVVVEVYRPSSSRSHKSSERRDSTHEQVAPDVVRLSRRVTRPPKNIEKKVLKDRNPTFCTPLVHRNAEALFDQVLKSARQVRADKADKETDDDQEWFGFLGLSERDEQSGQKWDGPPLWSEKRILSEARRRVVRWKGHAVLDSTGSRPREYYRAVKVDSITLRVGDFVTLPAGSTKESPERIKVFRQISSQSTNKLANTHWFAQILALFPDHRGQKTAHIRWLIHSSKTILQEAHHPRELFYTDECDDIAIGLIQAPCTVYRGNHVPKFTRDDPENEFFARYLWNEKASSFTDIEARAKPTSSLYIKCTSCQKMEEDVAAWKPRLKNGVLRIRRVEYHVLDFIYIINSSGIYDIGQITHFPSPDGKSVSVKRFGRYPSNGMNTRRLYLIDREINIPTSLLIGKCTVKHSSLVKDDLATIISRNPDLFLVNSFSDGEAQDLDMLQPLPVEKLQGCAQCTSDFETKETARKRPRLKMMDVFCGGGGMSQGFARSGVAQIKWGIDFSPASCETFQLSAIVYNQCINLLLERAVQVKPQAHRLLSLGRKEKIPPLPLPGEVDIMSISPPCTGFSGLNRFRSAHDVRNTLIAPGLSCVELLKPRFVLIENVLNMARFPLQGKDSGEGRIIGGIKWGTHLFVLRTFMDLGYQVRYSVLQAGQFGTPQNRHRIIYFAAKTGSELPDFPLPTHQFPLLPPVAHLPTGLLAPAAHRRFGVPHRPVVVSEAIYDLPKFHWQDPEKISPALGDGPSFAPDASVGTCGFDEPVPYRTVAASDYQHWIRDRSVEVSHHTTIVYGSMMTSRICNIPIHKNADHRALPQKLQIHAYIGTAGSAARNRLYPGSLGRVDEDGYFLTIPTVINPLNRQGRVLHPNQKRVLSVREWARAQGFSDRTRFISPDDNQEDRYRIIGNAVPIPLGIALARQFWGDF